MDVGVEVDVVYVEVEVVVDVGLVGGSLVVVVEVDVVVEVVVEVVVLVVIDVLGRRLVVDLT